MCLHVLITELTQNCQEISRYHSAWPGLYCRLERIVYHKEILGTPWHKVDILETGKQIP